MKINGGESKTAVYEGYQGVMRWSGMPMTCDLLRRRYGQGKGHRGANIGVRHPDFAPMRLDQPLTDRQTQSETLHLLSRSVFQLPKCFKNLFPVNDRDSLPFVAYIHTHLGLLFGCRDGDQCRCWRIAGRVAHQVHQYLSNSLYIGVHKWQVRTDIYYKLVVSCNGVKLSHRRTDDLAQASPLRLAA